jgi:hypothetical protein
MSRHSRLVEIARGEPGDGRGNILHGDRLERRRRSSAGRSSGNAASARSIALPP